MINIGICDDDLRWRRKIKTYCENIMNRMQQSFTILEFSSGEEVLEYNGDIIHLLFLDIEMQGLSGLEVMEKTRRNPHFWRIAFVSSHTHYRWDTTSLKTLAFLEKPIEEKAITSCLKAVVRETEANINIPIHTNDGEKRFFVEDIVYVRAQKNYVNVHLKDSDIVGYDSIKKLEDLFRETTMVRIHRSYMINLQFLKDITWTEATMSDGSKIPVGRMYYQTTRDAFFSYLADMTVERMRME